MDGNDKDEMQEKIRTKYKSLLEEIRENSNTQMLTNDKTDQDILNLLSEPIHDFKEQEN